MSEFDPSGVWASGVEQIRRMAAKETMNYAAWYRRAFENWSVEYERQGFDVDATVKLRGPIPQPPAAVVAVPETVEFPEYPHLARADYPCMEPLVLPIPPPKPAADAVVFGPLVEGWPWEAYYAAGSGGAPGREVMHDGKKFVLRQIGKIGVIGYVLLWELL